MIVRPLATIAFLSLVLVGEAGAQHQGHSLPGFPGLRSGSRAAPLGTHLAVSAVPIAFLESGIERNSLNGPGSVAFTDIHLQLVQLGWGTSLVDVAAGYGVVLSTGKWEIGGDDNAGLGTWSHQVQAGTTLHLDDRWTLSALGSYELHSHKKDTDIKVGDILTVEGGLGTAFDHTEMVDSEPVVTRVTHIGLVYNSQFKITKDQGTLVTPLAAGRTDRVFGVGVEGNVTFVKPGLELGLRIEPEFGARNRTQRWTLLFTATYELKLFARGS